VAVERSEIEVGVRGVLAARGKISADVDTLDSSHSLYDAGMTSHATVKVMLGLEDQFGVEFPDELLQRSVFDQVATITSAIEKLLEEW
jgi:acyl carrier protein